MGRIRIITRNKQEILLDAFSFAYLPRTNLVAFYDYRNKCVGLYSMDNICGWCADKGIDEFSDSDEGSVTEDD